MKESSEEVSLTIQNDIFSLISPTFIFRLKVAEGLYLESWENRITKRLIKLTGEEVSVDIGLPGQFTTMKLHITKRPIAFHGPIGEAIFELSDETNNAQVTVSYHWNPIQPILRKEVVITNVGNTNWDRLFNVRLGTYKTEAQLTGGEEVVFPPAFRKRAEIFGGLQGFPVYAEKEFFLSLAHPAGWNTQKTGEVSLRHYPGIKLSPEQSFTCMEAIYGVGPENGGKDAFVSYVQSRMRRTIRGHDHPYAIFEPFGGGDIENFDQTEEYILNMIRKVGEGQRESECKFDLFSLEFWVDYNGDMTRCNPIRFPNDFIHIKEELLKLNLKLGLWIDSSICGWSIGGNTSTYPALVQKKYRPGFGNTYYCRATEPIRSIYTQAFLYHIRQNGALLLKFDNFTTQCNNPNHDHLPGLYSTEAIINGAIECYRTLDQACPEIFIMLYWGYRSPWWLLYADTMFETGVQMEAASPGHMPAPFIRDGVNRKLDQGHTFAQDVPWLGTDSLGVWLSHWGGWNSGMGTERWQEGFIMDICRGHALAQSWSDPQWLTPAERQQMGMFIDLMKRYPKCFIHSRPILGDPWKDEPYGYCCTDGQRAILAINNGTWEDRRILLHFNSAWGLPNAKKWKLYCWYPILAELTDEGNMVKSEVILLLRAFEVVLFEAVPNEEESIGQRPNFPVQPIPTHFTESSRSFELVIKDRRIHHRFIQRYWGHLFKTNTRFCTQTWTLTGDIPAVRTKGRVIIVAELSDNGKPIELGSLGKFFLAKAYINGIQVNIVPVLGPKGYPSSWQAWRYEFESFLFSQSLEMQIQCNYWGKVEYHFSAHVLPQGQ